MIMMRRAVALIAASVLPLTGCGVVHETLERVTQVPIAEAPMVEVDAPNPALASDAVVADVQRSVIKIRSVAHACEKILEGSGFVIAPNRVMTSAHVVAGADGFTAVVDDQEIPATVVLYDPNSDISVLDVPGLDAPPLSIADQPAPTGADALVLGYPGGGPFVANPARIREVIELNGPDIYHTTTVSREVYVIRGKVGQGDSGGPLIDMNKKVLGVNFGAAVDDPDTGFALTAGQIYPQMVSSAGNMQPVATGACIT